MTEHVKISVADGILRITLARPDKKNALTNAMYVAVGEALTRAESDPAVRVVKSAEALRPEGLLATVATHHIAGGTESFFVDAQRCYERFDPATPPNVRLQPAQDIPEDDRELTTSGRFEAATFHRYEWELSYSTKQYLDLLLTYSGHRALPAEQQRQLLDCIARLIELNHAGNIVKRYLTELRLAQRTHSAP